MNPASRFEYFRRKLRKKLGAGSASAAAITRAASLEQVLEMAQHEMMTGKQFDAESISALRHQLAIDQRRSK